MALKVPNDDETGAAGVSRMAELEAKVASLEKKLGNGVLVCLTAEYAT